MIEWSKDIPTQAITTLWITAPEGTYPLKIESCVGLNITDGIPLAYGVTYKVGEDLNYKVVNFAFVESMDVDPDKIWSE